MDQSLVSSAISTARKTVAWCFVCTAIVVSALLAERVLFETHFDRAAETARRATDLAGSVMLEDERLTMSANMAAASGQQAWIDRYERHIPEIDKAIEGALALAPPRIANAFDAATKQANDRLVEMERRAIEAVRDGDPAVARAILDSPEYAAQKTILASGTQRFAEDLKGWTEAQVDAIQQFNTRLVAVLLLLSLVGFVGLWRKLSATLKTSEAGFLHSERRLRQLAHEDDLTGLPNRRAFNQRLEAMLSEANSGSEKIVAVALIDIDHFKRINDTLGHQAGDELIQRVASRIRRRLPTTAVIARLGGDELAIAELVKDEAEARAHIEGVSAGFEAPFNIGDQAIHVTVSAGVAFGPNDARTPADLIRLADIALYNAKAAGRGRARIFRAPMDAQVQERAALEQDLRQAVANNELMLHYQPLMSADGQRMAGVEALVRWRHPTKGMISPGIFVPIAEQSRLIIDLGEWVMRRAFEDSRRWPGLQIAINLSPIQFRHPNFLARVEEFIKQSGADPANFELEVTESLLLENNERTKRSLLRLREMGFQIALDDFGTGYSSLSYLRSFPFTKIKIDQSFTRGIETSAEAAQIIHAVVSLGRALQMTVVAEGVETAEQHRFLRAAGCQQLQGYLFARPDQVESIDRLFHADSGEPVARSA
jgi:diguanylate cyclase